MTRQTPPPAAALADTTSDPLAGFPPEVRDACAELPPLVLLRDVAEWSGYSTPGIYKAMDAGRFPRPLKLGANRIAWSRVDLARWLADRVETRAAAADAAAARRAGGGQ
jgi:prophage regulatory protein